MTRKPASSANLLVVGVTASALGGVLNVIGTNVNAAEVVSKYSSSTSPGTGWIVMGLVIALAGMIALVSGLYNLASGVDYLVQKASPMPVSAPDVPVRAPMDKPTETA